VRVTELGSFSKVAEDLSVSQSTITKQIAWLQGYLGARLLNRNTRGVSLTQDGLTYYEVRQGHHPFARERGLPHK